MSRAATKAEIERWQPPRHDFWLPVATRHSKWGWSARIDGWPRKAPCGRALPATYQVTAVKEVCFEFSWRRGFHTNGIEKIEDGLWFVFFLFERPEEFRKFLSDLAGAKLVEPSKAARLNPHQASGTDGDTSLAPRLSTMECKRRRQRP